ncbi:hypothetical protein A3F03_01765 [Candidatus Roizmanbacteria bacterium RIFCSPHIGHO2_12_FULL_41_11]|uniref:Peptidase C39-like domain-containing protein n=1 Tax=Candidatus Roizmanbacteria bacterium RIFCSPHIGHO2_12_FULL_41_11 TaxID=1802052 RepID=A0A1F7I094_9BACT|nr:MAG: hypothetical protein A3F03_01765 [Candidatus Roizmanbacteria bacterium RIFCSPHIGHO2_12_FULL_41_11]
MLNLKSVILSFTLVVIYAFFWIWVLKPGKINYPEELKPAVSLIASAQSVAPVETVSREEPSLETKIVEEAEKILPQSFQIPILNRKQFFNLSCEFAAASGIIYHFTNDPNFAVSNEENAEKILISKTPISKNPNIGIRMGKESISLDDIFKNLNQKFGGEDYYGIHAPPFIDIFEDFGLSAKPIYINNSTVHDIKKAIYSGNLVMAWIKIGYGEKVDEELLYGKVQIIKGEHAIAINGYDENGFIVMDVGSGRERHIDYTSLLNASSSFIVPFLQIYKADENSKSFSINDLTPGFDKLTQINRNVPQIYIQNGSDVTGSANQMREILKDFGYSIDGIGSISSFDGEYVFIRSKKNFSDFLPLLKRDLSIASYKIASVSADLADEETKDIVIIIGR